MLLARLADDRLLVVAGDVVEPDAVRVEVVEHRHAELVPLPVVGLRPARAAQYTDIKNCSSRVEITLG